MIGALVGALVVGANQSSFVPSQSTFLGAHHLPAYDIKTKVEELKCWRL